MNKAILVVAAFLATTPSFAAPPDNPDPALGPFYRSLRVPGTDTSCCSESDCRTTVTRLRNGVEEVFVSKDKFPGGQNEWVVVPDSRRLAPRDNPTGESVVCWTPGGGVLCFLRGSGT